MSKHGTVFLYVIVFLCLLCLTPVNSQKSAYQSLTNAIKKFESKYSRCAVLLLNASSGEKEYIYNNDFILKRRFPPGSVLKVLSAVILLENAEYLSYDPGKYLKCNGRFFPSDYYALTTSDYVTFNLVNDIQKGDHYFRCSLKHGHGMVNLHKALVESCNVYFLHSFAKKPSYCYRELVRKWHLEPEIDRKTVRNKGQATTMQYVASSIGEGGLIRTTPLNIAQIFAVICEDSPFLIDKKKEKGGTWQKKHFYIGLLPEHRAFIYKAMQQALSSGTLKKLSVKNKEVAVLGGKTGSATHFGKRYKTHAWNVLHICYRGQNYILVTFVYTGSGAREGRLLSETVLNAI